MPPPPCKPHVLAIQVPQVSVAMTSKSQCIDEYLMAIGVVGQAAIIGEDGPANCPSDLVSCMDTRQVTLVKGDCDG